MTTRTKTPWIHLGLPEHDKWTRMFAVRWAMEVEHRTGDNYGYFGKVTVNGNDLCLPGIKSDNLHDCQMKTEEAVHRFITAALAAL